MFKVCIVDDDANNTRQIVRLLQNSGLTSHEIKIFSNITDCRIELQKTCFDVIILDLHIPLRSDADASVQASIGFINSMHDGSCPSPVSIIGITTFADLYADQINFFEERLLALIDRSGMDNQWERALILNLKRLKSAIDKYVNSPDRLEKIDLLAITALFVPELQEFMKLGTDWVQVAHDDTIVYYKGYIQRKNVKLRTVVSSASQMGMSAAAVLATKLLERFSPRYAIMTGICAGVIEDNAGYGDGLLVSQSWDYGSGKWSRVAESKPVFKPDNNSIPLDGRVKALGHAYAHDDVNLQSIKREWKGVSPKTQLLLHVAPLASGASVVEDDHIIQEVIQQNRKALGIDMEAYGFLYAVSQSRRPLPIYFCLKSISDFANSEKDDDWQMYSSFISATISIDFIAYCEKAINGQ